MRWRPLDQADDADKFGGQPFVNDALDGRFKQQFINIFGAKNGQAMTHATAGSLIGIGEIVLLPLDVLKIKRQTNPEAFRNRGFARIVRDEGWALYRGWNWTAARNAPGSFAVRRRAGRARLTVAALRWLGVREEQDLRARGLRESDVGAKHRRLDRRRRVVDRRLAAARRDQDADPGRQL